MYGYVRPAMDRLSGEERELFQAAYCGLCRAMGRRYGQWSRVLLNYDFTFLAILLSPATDRSCRRCPAVCFQARWGLEGDKALDLAADCTVLLAWWQLQDSVADDGPLGGLPSRLLSQTLRRAYRTAAAARPAFDAAVQAQLARLAALERAGCASLDQPADAFAQLLAGVAEEVEDPVGRRVLCQLFYHLGRWVYLADAADDLAKDAARGRYNPLIGRFGLGDGRWTPEAKEVLGWTMDLSIRQMAAAFELWDFGPWAGIIRATLYQGLYAVGHSVLEGDFHKRRPRRGRKEQI